MIRSLCRKGTISARRLPKGFPFCTVRLNSRKGARSSWSPPARRKALLVKRITSGAREHQANKQQQIAAEFSVTPCNAAAECMSGLSYSLLTEPMVMWSSILVTPGAAQAACIASSYSARERAVPRRLAILWATCALI